MGMYRFVLAQLNNWRPLLLLSLLLRCAVSPPAISFRWRMRFRRRGPWAWGVCDVCMCTYILASILTHRAEKGSLRGAESWLKHTQRCFAELPLRRLRAGRRRRVRSYRLLESLRINERYGEMAEKKLQEFVLVLLSCVWRSTRACED